MKNNIFRVVLFGTILFFGFTGPLWLYVCTVVLYSFIYFGIEIIFIAFFIDAYFGYAGGGWYVYTLGTSVVLYIAQYLKPYLLIYNK